MKQCTYANVSNVLILNWKTLVFSTALVSSIILWLLASSNGNKLSSKVYDKNLANLYIGINHI